MAKREVLVTERAARRVLAVAGITADATPDQLRLVKAVKDGAITFFIRNPVDETVIQIPGSEVGGIAFLPIKDVAGVAADLRESPQDMDVYRAFFK